MLTWLKIFKAYDIRFQKHGNHKSEFMLPPTLFSLGMFLVFQLQGHQEHTVGWQAAGTHTDDEEVSVRSCSTFQQIFWNIYINSSCSTFQQIFWNIYINSSCSTFQQIFWNIYINSSYSRFLQILWNCFLPNSSMELFPT